MSLYHQQSDIYVYIYVYIYDKNVCFTKNRRYTDYRFGIVVVPNVYHTSNKNVLLNKT